MIENFITISFSYELDYRSHNLKAAGSNPAPATKFSKQKQGVGRKLSAFFDSKTVNSLEKDAW
jgi:hypothetical protein